MQRVIVTSLLVVGLVLGTLGVSSAELILNGGFEDGLNSWDVLNVSAVDFGASGNHAALLDVPHIPGLADPTVGAATLAQEFSVAPGTSGLQVSFDYLFNGIDTSMLVDDASFAKLSYTLGSVASDLDWTLFQFTSTSSEFGSMGSFFGTIQFSDALQEIISKGTLKFALLENYAWDGGVTDTQLYIDNVNVSTIPLPSALLLFASGLAGLAIFPRKIVDRYAQRTKLS